MIKIIFAIIVGLCAIFIPFAPDSSVSAKTINGNAGIDTPLSYLSFVDFAVNYDLIYSTRTYDEYATTGILNIISYNTLSANNFADVSKRSSNTGYTVDMGDIVSSGVVRPTQYQFNVNSSSSNIRNYTQFFFNNLTYNGSISYQIPLNFYYDGGTYDNAINVNPSIYSNINVYAHYEGDTSATELSYSVRNDTNFLYVSFDINGVVDNFSVHYSIATNSTYFSNGNYFTYWFTNVLFDTSGVAFNNGYLQGYTDANSTLNTDSVSYINGYQAGVNYSNNTININSASYQSGYNAGVNDAGSLSEIFSGVLKAPVNVVLDSLNFEIFGVNVGTFVLSLLTIGFIAIIVKLLL